jgi:hypothetical protein
MGLELRIAYALKTGHLDFIKRILQESKVFIYKLSSYGHENLVGVVAYTSP